MAREKKPVHTVQMTEGKRNIIQMLLQEYDIESAQDIQDALKDLLGGTIKEMMEAEMDGHLGYEKSERSDCNDCRNGYKRKRVNSRYGSMEIDVPQDRKSTFEPQVVRKRQKDISDIDQKIISMYAKGMTTRQISETIEGIYGFETSEGFISDVTDKILPQIEDWQNRPLDEVYPILYIDAIHYSVRDNGVIRKLAAYVILGINAEGRKEVLTISAGDSEMDAEISEFDETLEGQLGCRFANLQVFRGCQEGHIHNQCDRITEFHLPETQPPAERISKRYGSAEGRVSGSL